MSFAVIYRFHLKQNQESLYKTCWNKIADYFLENCGALGACLHKGEDQLWVAYSRWPDKATRDAAWPGDQAPDADFPEEICEAIKTIQAIRKENQDFTQYDDICLEVVIDKLTH